MTTTRSGVQGTNAVTPSASHIVQLPAGAAADELAVIGCVNPSWSAVFQPQGSGWTELLNAGNSATMHYGLFTKILTSTDISNGFLMMNISTSQRACFVVVTYSDASDVGAVGPVWDRGGTETVNNTLCQEIPDNGTDDVLCFALIKHSAAITQTINETPPITDLEHLPQSGSGVPSLYLGVFTGTPQDVDVIWNIYSSNGIAFQLPVLSDTPPPPTGPELMGIWDGAALDPVELLGVWDGSAIDAAETLAIV